MAELHCSVCGQSNPEDLEVCQFCGASLLPPPGAGSDPSPAIRPGEQPTRKNTGELEHALPSWLKTLRSGQDENNTPDADPDTEMPGLGKATPPADTSGDASDWLAGLDSAASEDEDEIPEWMAGLGVSTQPSFQDNTSELDNLDQVQPDADLLDLLKNAEADLAPVSGEPARGSLLNWEAPHPTTADLFPPTETNLLGTPAQEKPASEAIPSAHIPDWLETLHSKTSTHEIDPGISREEPPDWLSSLPALQPETPSPAPEFKPDWLSKLQGEGDQAGQESTPQASDPAETPGWLASLGVEAGPSATAVFTDEPAPANEANLETPDWLAQLKSDVKTATEADLHAQEFETASKPFQAEISSEPLPDWLSGIGQQDSSATGAPALVVSGESESPVETGQGAFSLETPDWLSRLRPEREPESVPATQEGNQDDADTTSLPEAELPSWVQAMRPVESVISGSAPSSSEEMGSSEGSGPLAGLRGVLPASPGFGVMRKPPAYSIKLQVNESQHRYAVQLEKMVQDEGKAREVPPVQPKANRVWRWLISAILIGSILLPVLTGTQISPELQLYPSEWARTGVLLNEFPTNSAMLLVFDYEPALSGELTASAAPVISTILLRGTRVALISTTPTGPALAEQFMESTQQDHLSRGTQVVNLGYLAGGPVGIQSFASDPLGTINLTMSGAPAWETLALQGVKQLSDFSAIIILTDNADSGRSWIEQTQADLGDTKLLLIISAQAEPMIRPYFDSGQVHGLVTGLVGGKTYEQSYNTPGLARDYWDSFGLSVLAVEMMVTAGSLWGVVKAWQNQKKNRGEA